MTTNLLNIGTSLSTASPSQLITQPIIPAPVIPKALTVQNTTPTPSVSPPPTPINTTNYPAIVAGASSYVTPSGATVDANGKVLNAPTQPQAPAPTPYTDAAKSVTDKIASLLGQDTGKAAYQQQQLQDTGAIDLQNKQNQLTAQLNSLATESANLHNQTMAGGSIENQLQLQSQGRGITTAGLAPQTADALRKNQIQQADLASRSLIVQSQYALNQGDLQTAQQTAQRAVDLKYQDIETQIDQQSKLLQLYTPLMTKEEQAKAQALQVQNDQAKADLATKKQQQQDLINYAQTNGDALTASKLIQLNPSSPTFSQDLAKLQAGIKINTQDQQIKNLQIQKLKQDLNPTPNPGEVVTLSGKPQNTSQASANGYADRLNQSNIIIDNLGSNFTGALDIGGNLPNFLQSSDRQTYEQAKRNFVTAVLRRESGAAISDSEFKTEDLKYFPQAGDKPANVIQKSNARNTAINNVYREANVSRPVLPGQIIESNGKRYRVASDGETLEPL